MDLDRKTTTNKELQYEDMNDKLTKLSLCISNMKHVYHECPLHDNDKLLLYCGRAIKYLEDVYKIGYNIKYNSHDYHEFNMWMMKYVIPVSDTFKRNVINIPKHMIGSEHYKLAKSMYDTIVNMLFSE